jgi:thiamine-phosphate pyrophosphorylase
MYLITNRYLCSEQRYLEVLKEASYSGVDKIVLREKDLEDYDLKNLYFKIKNIINPNTKIIINNNLKVYKQVDADGIHLSFKNFIKIYEQIKFSKKIIGVSTHSIKEIIEVKKREASYIFFSHVYETKCKENLKPKGIDVLKNINHILKNEELKLIALGGILPSNSIETLKYCDDIAVMSTIMTSSNVEETIKKYYELEKSV